MPAFEDLTGKKYGLLKVLYRTDDYVQPSGQHKRMYHCICECGRECDVRASDLKSGNTKSCGCYKEKSRGKSQFEDLTGRKFGRLTVLYRMPNHVTPSGQQQRVWHCLCSCGVEKDFYASQLKNGTISCGCISREKRKKKKEILQEQRDICKREKEQKKIRKLQQTIVERKLTNENKIKLKEISRVMKLNENNLKISFPEIAAEWHPVLNGELTPSDVMARSSEKVWWLCSAGHPYNMRISSRTGKQKCGCPYCSVPAKRVLAGFNDLATRNPDIVAEWHPSKNGTLKPTMVLSGSAKKVWWLGSCGHEFEMPIARRTGTQKGNCPYCSNQKLLIGFNDFKTKHPELLSEWDYEKNTVQPDEIGVGSHVKIWWRCPFGHSYQAFPSNRVGQAHSGCPICAKEGHTSFPEQALFYYINRFFPDVVNSDSDTLGVELDIYIPTKRVAIEYDGANWHRNNESYETHKNELCQKNSIQLIRIREEGLPIYDDCLCIIRNETRQDDSLIKVIAEVLAILGVNDCDIDFERDRMLIYSQYISNRKSKSVASNYPQLVSEWNTQRNGEVTPDLISYGSSKIVWWICPEGHEYRMRVSHRTLTNCNCPICSGKRVLKGFNDLKTQYPDLVDEWDYEKNTSCTPDEVSPHSDRIVWWKCKKCGYEWKAKIDGRTRMKAGCPKCGIATSAKAKWKAVKNINTGDIYESLIKAEEATGVNRVCISNVCRGKQKKAGGYRWAFL